jgi:AAA family ATP:ADP antiporter
MLLDTLSRESASASMPHVVRVLSRVERQEAVDALLSLLPVGSRALRRSALLALSRLRSRARGLRFESDVLRKELHAEVRYHQQIRLARRSCAQGPGSAEQLLRRALGEKRRESLELVFRLLGLVYSPGDMHNAFIAISSGHARARANAIEFLDNVLSPEDRRRVLPVLEGSEAPAASGGEATGHLRRLIEGRDAWLRACAVLTAASEPALVSNIEAALGDPDGVVREAAALSLARREGMC